MLKSAPTEAAPINVEHNTTVPVTHIDGVPIEMARHFNLNTRMMSEQDKVPVNRIFDYLGGGQRPMGDLLQELSSIERHLGCKMKGDGYNSVYAYLKLTSQIRDIEKQRDALRG